MWCCCAGGRSQFMVNIKSRILVALDPELRAINGVIRRTMGEHAGHPNRQNDQDFFIDRITRLPKAMKMSYWENHFEWKTVMQYPELKGRILDFGCGSGHSDILLARNGYTIHGIDSNTTGIAIAEYLRSREIQAVRSRLSFSIENVTMPRKDRELFDSAWAAHVFEHIERPGPVLKGLRNWLKQGAHMLISVPLGNAYDDPGHIHHFYDCEQLALYLRQHVRIVKLDVSQEFQVIRALCLFT